MAAYLSLSTFSGLSLMPSALVAELDAREPGWIDAQLTQWSAWLDARLGKRYAAPFASPPPVQVTDWLQRIVTARSYLKLGTFATDRDVQEIIADGKAAQSEVAEAADSESSKFSLPLRADTNASGASRAFPRFYTEMSPYTASDVQQDARDFEEQTRRGFDG